MSAFPKADVQNAGIGVELNVRLWPKADIQTSRTWANPGRFHLILGHLRA